MERATLPSRNSDQLHLNRPSDQLSPRTPRRTLLHEAWSLRRVKFATAAAISKQGSAEQCPRLSPSLSPALNLFPQSPKTINPLSTAFTPNRPLTPLSTAFTQTHRGVGYRHDFSFHWTRATGRQSRTTSHAVSYSSELFVAPKKINSFAIKQIQTLSSRHPGYGVPLRHPSVLCASALFLRLDFLTLCFHNLPNPFSCNSFPCTSIQNPRGVTLLTSSIFTLTPLHSRTFTLFSSLLTLPREQSIAAQRFPVCLTFVEYVVVNFMGTDSSD